MLVAAAIFVVMTLFDRSLTRISQKNAQVADASAVVE
jgi:hypothetical protein